MTQHDFQAIISSDSERVSPGDYIPIHVKAIIEKPRNDGEGTYTALQYVDGSGEVVTTPLTQLLKHGIRFHGIRPQSKDDPDAIDQAFLVCYALNNRGFPVYFIAPKPTSLTTQAAKPQKEQDNDKSTDSNTD